MTGAARIAGQVAAACGATLASSRTVAGGDINEALRVELDDGRALFVKHRAAADFAAEEAGLRWLAEPGALRLPAPVARGEGWLALEWVDTEPRSRDFDEALGAGLARLHAAGADGFAGEMHVGPILLPGDPAPDWPTFYGEHRLAPLLRLATDRDAPSRRRGDPRRGGRGAAGRGAEGRIRDRPPARAVRAARAARAPARRPLERQRDGGPAR